MGIPWKLENLGTEGIGIWKFRDIPERRESLQQIPKLIEGFIHPPSTPSTPQNFGEHPQSGNINNDVLCAAQYFFHPQQFC